MVQKANNNLEFRDKRDSFRVIVDLYPQEVKHKLLSNLVIECLDMSLEGRFSQEEKDSFDRLARTVSEYIETHLSFGDVKNE